MLFENKDHDNQFKAIERQFKEDSSEFEKKRLLYEQKIEFLEKSHEEFS